MLSRRILLGTVVLTYSLAGNCSESVAQFFGNGCSSCGNSMPVAQTAMAECTPIQPVYSTCYQTVPVTTYAREKQTVEVPYYQTEYEDREYTVMRPVTRQREVEVPTVTWQNVTETRTVTKDMGRWVTNYQPIQRCSPCQVDPRPGVIGWLNRTGYSMQTAMMPSYTTSRQYIPNMMACTVPVTRQVAVQGTRRVTVSETRMVAERKVEKVAVQKLAYRKEEVTVMRPQTAYRTVPIGTTMAYGGGFGAQTAYYPYGAGTAMAYGLPIIESSPSRSAAAARPEPDPNFRERSADRTTPFPEDDPRSSSETFKRNDTSTPATGASHKTFRGDGDADKAEDTELTFPADPQARRVRDSNVTPAKYERPQSTMAKSAKPSSGGWRAARSHSDRHISGSSRSASRLSVTKLTLADSDSETEKN
jgi:hypothetical protein